MVEKVFDNYEVHDMTFALLPSYHHDFETIAVEMHHIFGIRKPALRLIKVACLNGGADYNGRRRSVLHKMGPIHKAPIPIDPKNDIYAFPTHAANHPDCAWLFLHHIMKVEEDPNHKGCSLVTFSNGYVASLKASLPTILNQMNRTSRCIIHFSPTFQSRKPISSFYFHHIKKCEYC